MRMNEMRGNDNALRINARILKKLKTVLNGIVNKK